MKFDWKLIYDTSCTETYRSKVFGGWVLRFVRRNKDEETNYEYISDSMIFVPDPKHEWTID